jgi:hypothetical protein
MVKNTCVLLYSHFSRHNGLFLIRVKSSFNLLNEIFSDDNIMRPYEFGAHTFLPSDKQYFIKRGYKKGGVSDAGV